MNIKQKCKECVAEGQESRIQMSPYGTTTAMMLNIYYDKDGNLHHHDPNTTLFTGHCSRGHDVTVHQKRKCWCQEEADA